MGVMRMAMRAVEAKDDSVVGLSNSKEQKTAHDRACRISNDVAPSVVFLLERL